MSKPPCFWLMEHDTSKLHCNEQGSDFRYLATEIEMSSNGFSEN